MFPILFLPHLWKRIKPFRHYRLHCEWIANHCLQSFNQDSWWSWLDVMISPESFVWCNLMYCATGSGCYKTEQFDLFSADFFFSRAEAGQELLEANVWARAYHVWLSHDHCCLAIRSAFVNAIPKMEDELRISHCFVCTKMVSQTNDMFFLQF